MICPWSHSLYTAEQRFRLSEVWLPNPYSSPLPSVPLEHTQCLLSSRHPGDSAEQNQAAPALSTFTVQWEVTIAIAKVQGM